MISKKQFIMMLVLIIIGVGQRELFSQHRTETKFQVQLNMAGTFINTFGQALSDSEVESFQTKDWIVPGIDVGYYLTKRFYLGYGFTPSRTHILKEPWGLSGFERDANITVQYQSGNYHNLNLRYFPFRSGLYLGASLVAVSKSDYNLTTERVNSTLRIGTGTYDTDVSTDWNFKRATGIGFSMGYTHIFKNRMSLGFGLVVPMISEPYYENIQVNPENPLANISPEDLGFAINKIRNETFFYPIQVNLHIGYNFKFF